MSSKKEEKVESKEKEEVKVALEALEGEQRSGGGSSSLVPITSISLPRFLYFPEAPPNALFVSF